MGCNVFWKNRETNSKKWDPKKIIETCLSKEHQIQKKISSSQPTQIMKQGREQKTYKNLQAILDATQLLAPGAASSTAASGSTALAATASAPSKVAALGTTMIPFTRHSSI